MRLAWALDMIQKRWREWCKSSSLQTVFATPPSQHGIQVSLDGLEIGSPEPALIEMAKMSDAERVDVGNGWTIINTPKLLDFDFRTYDLEGPPSIRTEYIIRNALARFSTNVCLSGDNHDVLTSMHSYDWIAWTRQEADAPQLDLEEVDLLSRALLAVLGDVPTCIDHVKQREETPCYILWSMSNINQCEECRFIGGLDPHPLRQQNQPCRRSNCITCDRKMFTGKCPMCDYQLSIPICDGFDAPERVWVFSPVTFCPNYDDHGWSL